MNNFLKHSFLKHSFCEYSFFKSDFFKSSIKTVLATTFIASVNTANAADVSNDIRWDELSVSYENFDNDDFSRTGVSFSGMKLADDNVFVRGQYSILSGEDTFFSRTIEENLNWLSLGVGYKVTMDKHTDLFGALSYEHLVFEESEEGFSEKNTSTGHSFEFGFRSLVTKKIEFLGSLNRLDIGDDAINGYRLGARYYINDQFSAGVSLLKFKGNERLNISGVWHF